MIWTAWKEALDSGRERSERRPEPQSNQARGARGADGYKHREVAHSLEKDLGRGYYNEQQWLRKMESGELQPARRALGLARWIWISLPSS